MGADKLNSDKHSPLLTPVMVSTPRVLGECSENRGEGDRGYGFEGNQEPKGEFSS